MTTETIIESPALPSEDQLLEASKLTVLDSDGNVKPFPSLYEDNGTVIRHLIVFIRHFFCGNCQAYVQELSATISPEALLALDVPTSISIIGCGDPALIKNYKEATASHFPIYADPSQKLYNALGMVRSLELGAKPDYIKKGLLSSVATSFVQAVKAGAGAFKGGDIKQVGGDFIFQNGKVTWCQRMKTTRDHAEISELKRLLGYKEMKQGGEEAVVKKDEAAAIPAQSGPPVTQATPA